MTPEKLLEILGNRQRAYQLVFNTVAGKEVLDDLAAFCRANESCIVSLGKHAPAQGFYAPVDRDRTLVLESRREVWLRIRAHLDNNNDQLLDAFTRPATGAISHDDQTAPTD